ncbi:MAG: ECF transporter S component [Promethearchaeia archaeon]
MSKAANKEEESQNIEKESGMSKRTQITLQISGSAIFAALSITLAPLTSFIPRFGAGMAYFDPISIIWISAFLIFGPWAGIFCSIIGTVLLFPFDPFAPIGPLMKFVSTVILILVYTIGLRLYREDGTSKKLKKIKNFLIWGIIATIAREIIMILLNIPAYIAITGGTHGLGFWLIGIAVTNPIQSLADLAIPYLLVYTTKLDEKFELW